MLGRRRLLAAGALVGALTLTGCTGTPLDNVVEGLVAEGTEQVGEQLQGGAGKLVEGLVDDLLGGTGISTDGQLPPGFPEDDIPLTGTVLGGGSAPNGAGWVVRTKLAAASEFAEAQTALESAGYTASAVNADQNSGFGTFSGAGFTVVLVVSSTSVEATATYVVTAA
jgi:hypothetical protein